MQAITAGPGEANFLLESVKSSSRYIGSIVDKAEDQLNHNDLVVLRTYLSSLSTNAKQVLIEYLNSGIEKDKEDSRASTATRDAGKLAGPAKPKVKITIKTEKGAAKAPAQKKRVIDTVEEDGSDEGPAVKKAPVKKPAVNKRGTAKVMSKKAGKKPLSDDTVTEIISDDEVVEDAEHESEDQEMGEEIEADELPLPATRATNPSTPAEVASRRTSRNLYL